MTADLLVLEGADLIDGSGGPAIADSMVVLDGNCIRYAGPRTGRFEGMSAMRWPLRGKTIIPGLIEAHTTVAPAAFPDLRWSASRPEGKPSWSRVRRVPCRLRRTDRRPH